MKLPNIPIEKSSEFTTREEYAQNCIYNTKFYENYHECYLRYKSFLDENDISLR